MSRERQPTVYMMASGRNGTIYLGVTSNLAQRAHQHRTGAFPGFAARYRCKDLVWFEQHSDMISATTREKRLKGSSRARKLGLIYSANPTWRDLYDEIV